MNLHFQSREAWESAVRRQMVNSPRLISLSGNLKHAWLMVNHAMARWPADQVEWRTRLPLDAAEEGLEFLETEPKVRLALPEPDKPVADRRRWPRH